MPFPLGCEHYLKLGRTIDEDGFETLMTSDTIYFGAEGSPRVSNHVSLPGLRLAVSKCFGQFVCIRPVLLLPGVTSPLRDATTESIDWIVARESTEGEYLGMGSTPMVVVVPGRKSRSGCHLHWKRSEQILGYAFDHVSMRPRRKVTSVTENNAQQYGMNLWDDGFSRVAIDYPNIGIAQWLVEAMVARFVMRPDTLDVIVAPGLSNDILSDFDSALLGSRGIAASANIDPL